MDEVFYLIDRQRVRVVNPCIDGGRFEFGLVVLNERREPDGRRVILEFEPRSVGYFPPKPGPVT